MLAAAGFVGYALTRPEATPQKARPRDANVVSEDGLHYHPQLAIYINGEKQIIPTDIGKSDSGHKSPHTHDETGELHWENTGRVTKDDLRLGKLFESWGKSFNTAQLFDKTDADGTKITMTVNGQPNTELGNHLVADKEQIEIKYQD